MSLAHFDPAAEAERFRRRRPLLERQAALRLVLGEGIAFQPETAESVADQIRETLWAEGVALEEASPGDLAELRASFAELAPGRESIAATLFLAFPDAARGPRLAALADFPDQLCLRLASGLLVAPEVDRGAAGPGGRLPSVLALRYALPPGDRPAGLVSGHPTAPVRIEAPEAWAAWNADPASPVR